MTAGMDYLRGDTGGALGALFGAAKGAFQQKRGEQRTRSEKTSAADGEYGAVSRIDPSHGTLVTLATPMRFVTARPCLRPQDMPGHHLAPRIHVIG
jgi:hypothetical protein